MNIDDIYFSALEQTSEEARADYLDKVCGDDVELRRRVDRLLAAQANLGSYLESPAPELMATLVHPSLTIRPGEQIGPYKLLERIGEGGMGMVFMAEQQHPVCHAIQHAHQKGIIHRDIKPSNVLVAEYDDQPLAKVIDFGVAKAVHQPLTDKTMFTGLGQIIGTLEYMSREQARVNQLDIDTRSDVYSLGVLLYELLTGSTPFDRQRLREAALDELLRIIREEEPARPSHRLSGSATLPSIAVNRRTEPARLSKLMRGELDWMVMKALEKDRNRRYETANGLALDIQRYLADEPVLACPPSTRYRFQKFARRNKAMLATTVLVAAALVLGLVATTWQGNRAARAERRALANESRALANEQQAIAERDEKEAARRALYADDVSLASHIWESDYGTRRQVVELLQHQIPTEGEEDLREFAWYYQRGRVERNTQSLSGPKQPRGLAIDTENRLLALDADGSVYIWEASAQTPSIRSCTAHPLPPSSVALARTGDYAAWWSAEQGLQVVVARTGERVHQYPAAQQPKLLKFSDNGQYLALIDFRHRATIWNMVIGNEEQQFQLQLESFAACTISPDGKKLIFSRAL